MYRECLWKKCRAENIVGGALSYGEAHKRVCAVVLALLRQRHSRRKPDDDSSEQEKGETYDREYVLKMLRLQHFDDMRAVEGVCSKRVQIKVIFTIAQSFTGSSKAKVMCFLGFSSKL